MMSRASFAELAKSELIDVMPATRRAMAPSVCEQRDHAERVVQRARYLAPRDEQLIVAVFDRGITPGEAAILLGIRPETARRRIRRLLERMSSRLFTFVLTHLETWEPERQTVARSRFLESRSIRDTTRATGISMHYVRLHDAAIRETFRLRCEEVL